MYLPYLKISIMKKSYFLLNSIVLLMMLISVKGWGQVSLTNAAPQVTITFGATIPGVINGAYNGTGFQPVPAVGQLDSDAWAVAGWSDGDLTFGGTKTSTGDYGQGVTGGGVNSNGGFFALTSNVPSSGTSPVFWIAPGSSDFHPGTITLKVKNNGTTNLTSIQISYNLFVRNDGGRSSSFDLSYSSDNSTYTTASGATYTTPAGDDALGNVNAAVITKRISGLSIAPGAYYYFRWTTDDVAGVGSRDEIGIDNIAIAGTYGLALSMSSTNGTCNASCDGTATVNVSGGRSPFSYSWTTSGSTTSTASSCVRVHILLPLSMLMDQPLLLQLLSQLLLKLPPQAHKRMQHVLVQQMVAQQLMHLEDQEDLVTRGFLQAAHIQLQPGSLPEIILLL
jgi:hypothetical protein